MPLICAAIVPHSPVLIPTIGKEHAQEYTATLEALSRLNQSIYGLRLDELIIISPHGTHSAPITGLVTETTFTAHLKEFGDLTYSRTYKSSARLLYALKNHWEGSPLYRIVAAHELDYGASVPLIHLLDEQHVLPLTPIQTGTASLQSFYSVGVSLGERIHLSHARIGILASAELSHTHHDPAYADAAKKFDHLVIDALKRQDGETLLHQQTFSSDEIKSCGLPPLALLSGVLESSQYRFEVHAYEKSLGVGLLTAEFMIPF